MTIDPLTAIVDDDAARAAGWTLATLARACLDGGARFLQLRAKSAPSGRFLDEARAVVADAHARGAIVIVNDRADIAALAGADGVHVGQDDLPPALVRRVAGGRAVVGLSTHTTSQIDAAVAMPLEYLAVGPVFATATKATGHDAVGLSRVAYASDRARPRRLPVVAIGGITLDRAPEVLRAGAASVAVISDLLIGGDPAARVAAYLQRLAAPGVAGQPDHGNV